MNEKGFSLVEIVAAILLTSVILISFFTFFIQSKKFEQVNEEKYTAAQLSEELVHILETSEYNPSKPNDIWNAYYKPSIPNEDEYYPITVNGKVYYIQVEPKEAKDFKPQPENNLNLLKLTIFVDKNNEKKEVMTNYAYQEE